jgi:hypothetical protein
MIARTGRSASGARRHPEQAQETVPFLMKPTSVTVTKTATASTAVTAICDVVVKLVGIRPGSWRTG